MAEDVNRVDTDGAGAYSSLNAWESAEGADMSGDDPVAELSASSGSADTTNVAINGFSNYGKIIIRDYDSTGRASTEWDTSVYRHSGGSYQPITLALPDIELWNVQVEHNPTSDGHACVQWTDVDILMDGCHITTTDVTNSNNRAIDAGYVTGNTLSTIRNCIVDGFSGTTHTGIFLNYYGTSGDYNAYNNTINDCTRGFAGGWSVKLNEGKNNLFQNCTDDFAEYTADSPAVIDYNLTDNSTLEGTNTVTSSTINFVSATDFALASGDTDAIDGGTTAGSTVDINGTSRGATYDIGCHEYVASGVDLVIADSSHAMSSDNIGLTQAHSLAVQEAAHAMSSDNIGLTQAHQLAIQETTHGHTAENVVLEGAIDLIISGAAHAHAADSLGLTQDHQLEVQDSLHGHMAENIALTQLHILSIDEALHAHVADQCDVSTAIALVIADALHFQTVDNIALTQDHQLVIAEALHSHTAEEIALTQDHILIIDDSLHSMISDNVLLSIAGFDVVPASRTFYIFHENKNYYIMRENRTFYIEE